MKIHIISFCHPIAKGETPPAQGESILLSAVSIIEVFSLDSIRDQQNEDAAPQYGHEMPVGGDARYQAP
jgi:hypothetical protein